MTQRSFSKIVAGLNQAVQVSKGEMRCRYRLTKIECEALDNLPTHPESGLRARRFWGKVAEDRGLDPETIIGCDGERYSFTALTVGHGKHWCWPAPLNVAPVSKSLMSAL